MNRCPLCLAETGEPPIGVARGVLLCSGCLGLAPMDRLQLAANAVLGLSHLWEERLRALARLLADEGMQVVREAAKLDQAATKSFAASLDVFRERERGHLAEAKRLRAALEAISDRGHDYTATGYVSSRHDEDCGRCVARRALGLDGQPPHETGPSCPPHCDGGAA